MESSPASQAFICNIAHQTRMSEQKSKYSILSAGRPPATSSPSKKLDIQEAMM